MIYLDDKNYLKTLTSIYIPIQQQKKMLNLDIPIYNYLIVCLYIGSMSKQKSFIYVFFIYLSISEMKNDGGRKLTRYFVNGQPYKNL